MGLKRWPFAGQHHPSEVWGQSTHKSHRAGEARPWHLATLVPHFHRPSLFCLIFSFITTGCVLPSSKIPKLMSGLRWSQRKMRCVWKRSYVMKIIATWKILPLLLQPLLVLRMPGLEYQPPIHCVHWGVHQVHQPDFSFHSAIHPSIHPSCCSVSPLCKQRHHFGCPDQSQRHDIGLILPLTALPLTYGQILLSLPSK